MSGSQNDVLFATNVDFTGGSPATAQMTANGQLLIGASVAPFLRANTLTAGTGIAITNGAGTITITNTGGGGGGSGTNSLAGNSGSAPNIAGVINVIGSTGLTTTGDGVQTLTITPTGNLLGLSNLAGTGYVVHTGAGTFIERTFIAGSGISLSNPDGVAGATTITAGLTVPTTFTEDSGTATPSANNINIVGTSAQGISTSGSGATVTITAANATSTQKGVASFNGTEFTVTAGAVASNAITVTAGTGLTTGGSVNLGGSVTLALDVPVTVPHGGTGQVTLTNHGVVLGQGTSAVAVTTAGTDGQALLGATGADPAFATIAGTQGVTLTTGAHSLSIGLVAVPNSALSNSSITITGGSGITVTGSPVSLGGSVTISASGTTVTQFQTDSGLATPVGNNINLFGTSAQGISTSGSGSTVTFTVANATTTTKGVASFNSSDFTVSSGAVSLLSTGAGKTITGDSGGALSPTANNWNILGQQAGTVAVMDTIGSGSTLKIENRTWLTTLVVDASTTVGTRGTYSTITAALAAAVSGQDIFIRPGIFTEDLSLVAGVNLVAFTADAFSPNVTIIGKLTFTGSGNVSISGIRLQTNGDYAVSVSGSSASVLQLYNCFIYANNHSALEYSNSNGSAGLSCFYCRGDTGSTGTYYTYSGSGSTDFKYCDFLNNGASTVASTTSKGTNIQACQFNFPIGITTNNVVLRNSTFTVNPVNTTAIALTSGGSINATHCRFSSGTASAITIATGCEADLYECVIGSTNTNPITGAGTLTYGGLVFSQSGNAVNVTTQTAFPIGPRISLPEGPQVLAGSGSPSGSVTAPQGSLYLRTDGTTINNRMYVNTNGTTGWAAVTTAS